MYFLHFNFIHIFFNSIALLVIGSLVSPSVFAVCYLRFPQNFTFKWYRLDVIIVIAFFIFANDNIGSFMTHIFGFVAGIIVSFGMVLVGWINKEEQKSIEK